MGSVFELSGRWCERSVAPSLLFHSYTALGALGEDAELLAARRPIELQWRVNAGLRSRL